MKAHFAIILGIAVVASALGAWRWFDAGGDDEPRGSAVLGSSLAVPAASPTPLLRQPPRLLPITPVPVTYEVIDPAFEALPGARALYGEYEGGGYQIEVPGRWNGDVVYFAHGFRGNPPALFVSAPALRRHFIERGYAWAASSYSRNGYEPGAGARDTYALRAVFEERVGAPGRSYLYGESMGGNVVTFALEQYPAAYDGALSECGVVSGREVLDYFASWTALAQYLTGVDVIIEGASAAELEAIIRSQVLPALGAPDAPTDAGRAFTDAIMLITGGPRPFFHEGFLTSIEPNFMIIAHGVELAGPPAAAAQNIDTYYAAPAGLAISAEQLNREIDRFVSAPVYRDAVAYPEFQPMSGRIERPLLTIHGTGDMLAPIALEQSYRRTVDAAGRGHLLVQRAVRRAGHCNFTMEERRRAFDDLVAWVEDGVRPEGEDLTGDLTNAGLRFTSPLPADGPADAASP